MEQQGFIQREVIPEGHIDALPDMDEGRYMPSSVPLHVSSAEHRADMVQAHYDFLTARQRESGVRVRLCSTGRYSIYNAAGHFIATTTTPGTWAGVSVEQLQTAAMRMAYSEELHAVAVAADADFEKLGTVSEDTVRQIRALLTKVDAK